MATVLYWEGILASNAFVDSSHLEAKVDKVLVQLLRGEYRGADLDLKRCGKQGTEYPLYSAKLSKDDRLLFTTLQRGTSRQLLLLECVENHDYQKARFMKHGVLKAYMAHGTEWEAVNQPVVAPSPSLTRYSLEKVWSVLGGILSFTDLQESVLKMPTPLLILGAAGTGKTCIAQALLCKAAMHGCTSVLYVAQSRALVQVVSDSLTADPGVEVDVLTYSQLAQSTLREVGFEVLCEWLSEDPVGQTAYDKLSGKNEAFDAVAGRIYEELRIYSGCRDAEEYGALGVRQRLLQEERAGFVPGVYRQYQEYLAERWRVDLGFAEVPLAAYDLVVVDEGQDFSRLQLKQLHAAARNRSLVVCMDPQQSIHDAISSKDYLTALCGPHDPPLSVVTLPETFRTPLSVIPVVNRVLDLRRVLIGGISHKDEYLEVHPSKFTTEQMGKGEVHWISPTEEAGMRGLRDACGRFATFVVVVPSQEHVDSAVDMFDTPLVLTAAQAKGLEYEHVVAVGPFPEGDPILAQAERKCPKTRSSAVSQNHRTKDKSQTQDLAFLPPLNRVFVTFTRTSNSLYIVQNPAVYPNLVGYIKRAEDAAPTVTVPAVPDSSVTDWEKEMQRQQKRGNVDVARTIQNRQIDPERFRLEGNEHFKKGEYDLAVRVYRAALEGRRTAKVLCNLAAAQLKLHDLDGSIESCRGSVAADPTFGKAYFRLAAALRQKGGDPDELLRAAVTAKSFFPDDRDVAALLQSVAPGCDVLSVSTQGYFTMICSIGLTEKYYVVLQPGQYTIIDPFTLSCNIVGVGNPTVATDSKRVSHVVDATNGVRLLLAGVTFRGSSREQVSAICSSSRSTVTMLDCTVRGFSDNAVLSIGDCNVKNCTFQDLRLAGIEVRDGGSARVVGSTFERCRQGVAAYGGFALLKLHRSTVSDCEREGLLVHGTSNSPGMTELGSNDHVAYKAFLQGCNKGTKSTATISECHILGNRGLGVSIDLGVTANVLKTRISNNGSKGLMHGVFKSKGLMHGVFKHGVLVKGGSTVLLHTCAFSKNGDSGVRVEINYSAVVRIVGCVFAEEKKNIDELALHHGPEMQLERQLHSTLAERSEIKEVSYARQLPDVTASASTAVVASAPKDKGAEQERNPLRKPVFCPLSEPYMAMGTTKGVEVVSCPVEGPEWCNVLLGACGDVRNVLTTMASEHTKTGRFHLVLNDVEPAILARDLVLLNIIATGRDAAHCLSVWGNHFLSSDCSKAMLGVIGTLLDGTAPLSGDMDDVTKEAVHKVLRTWLTLKPKAGTLQRNLTEETLDQAVAISVQASAGVDRKVVAQYFKDGFLPTGSRAQGRFTKSPNVTLFPHGGHYDMYPTCSIFRAVPSPSIAAMQQTVQAQCAALRKALGEDRLRVTVVCEDLLAFLETTNLRFAFADVSNLSDYTSLPPLFALLRRTVRQNAFVTFQNSRESPAALRLHHDDAGAWGEFSGIHEMKEYAAQGHIKFMSAELRGVGLNAYSGLAECLELAAHFDLAPPVKGRFFPKSSVNLLLRMLHACCAGDKRLYLSVGKRFVHDARVARFRPQLESYLLGSVAAAPRSTVELGLIMEGTFSGVLRNILCPLPKAMVALLSREPLADGPELSDADLAGVQYIFDSFTHDAFEGRLKLKMESSDVSALGELFVTLCGVEEQLGSQSTGTSNDRHHLRLPGKIAGITRLSGSHRLYDFYATDGGANPAVPVAHTHAAVVPDSWSTLATTTGEKYVSAAVSVPQSAAEETLTVTAEAHDVVVLRASEEVYRFDVPHALVAGKCKVRLCHHLRVLSVLAPLALPTVP